MKFAIDRYAVGQEAEVSAEDFENLYYIPGRRERFFCPECGEVVFYRNRGGNHPSQFFHQEKTNRSPECDKRVDGRSELSLSQRVGLPIFLTGTISKNYQLSIGFPALGADMLEKADNANYRVKITDGNHYRKVKIDHTNFIDNEITLIPVNFIPPNGENYTITISGEKTVYGLNRKWSNYADGFDVGGAIFSYDENGGKKVHRGDSISTNRSYFAFIKNNIPPYPKINAVEIGSITIGEGTYKVFKIKIDVSVDDKSTFTAISGYLRQNFGVWLLECPSELVPIWPPAIQRDYVIPLEKNEPLLCAVSSGNANPSVYVYSDAAVYRKEINQDINGIHLVEINSSNRPTLLSVDRKYVGREITVQYKEIPQSNYRYEIDFEEKNSDRILKQEIDSSFLSKEFTVLTNAKLELYTGTRDKIYRKVPIRNHSTCIPAREKSEELLLVVESAVVLQIRGRKKGYYSHEYAITNRLIQAASRGSLVPVPWWVGVMLKTFKQNHEDILYELVTSAIRKGKMHSELLKQLRLLDLDRARLKESDRG